MKIPDTKISMPANTTEIRILMDCQAQLPHVLAQPMEKK